MQMNVIFLDFDGVLNTTHLRSLTDIERKVKILSYICHEYNCKIVIESSSKDLIDETTLEVKKDSWIYDIFKLFKKYNIECIGRTPNVEKKISEYSYLPMWKEDEIIKYLEMHPEIKHYCIIDDDDTKVMHFENSDLDKVRDHLIVTSNFSNNYEEEGLLLKHKEEVGKILKKDINYNK